jgi:hypothetical protein
VVHYRNDKAIVYCHHKDELWVAFYGMQNRFLTGLTKAWSMKMAATRTTARPSWRENTSGKRHCSTEHNNNQHNFFIITPERASLNSNTKM